MAGRGCTITIKVLGGAIEHNQSNDISLPVALHSPLSVLKEELSVIVAISPADQVLILCDLTDPDRNSDVLLAGMDGLTLHDCGIRNGSVLTLHALGMPAELRQQMAQRAFTTDISSLDQLDTRVIDSVVPAQSANHSYNGIIFDVESKGPHELAVFSVSVAGMLGRVRIYVRDCGWSQGPQSRRTSGHWWTHRESLSTEGWRLVADQHCRPSWDRPMEVRFTEPVIILPHRRRAIYCHSGLPDDLGIQYQSYGEDSIVGEDEYVRLLPGLGHTGSEPFDDTQGWYRSYRGLAGSVRYRARRMNWNPPQHSLFPVALRNAVVTMLLIQRFGDRYGRNASNLWSLPRDVVLSILELMHFDWFEELETRAPPPARAVNRPRQPSDLSNIHQLMAFLQGHGYFLGGEGDEDDDEVEDVVDDAYEEEEDSDEMEEDDEEDDDYEYEDNGLELMGRGYDDDDNDDDFDNDDLDDDGLGAMDEPDENGNEERAVFGDDYRKGAAAAYAEMEADAMDWQPPGAREYDSRDEDDYDDEVDDLGC